MSRLLSLLAAAGAVVAGSLLGQPAPGTAASGPSGAVIDVVEVEGVIDPALAGYLREEIESAERDGATVVLQLDSRGAYGGLGLEVGRAIRRARVPVVAWVGPSGARVEGGALFLVYGSSLAAMAPGAGIGPARPFDLSTAAGREDPARVAGLARELAALASGAGVPGPAVRALVEGPALPAGPAREAGAVAVVAADVRDLLQRLDGRSVRTAAGETVLSTLDRPGRPVTVRFREPGPVRRALHAVATPTAVYVLLVVGAWALAFEATQPGLGIAGLGGVVALAFAGYGLTVVPVAWPGLALLLAGMALQGLDVAVRRVGALTAAGAAAFTAGSVWAWRGVAPAIDLPLWLVGVATAGGVLFFGFALTVALRSRERVRAAQVGLVGLVGEVRSDLDPEGGVMVKGALWRARGLDGPIPRGRRVRVRGIDGLILQVEEEPD